MSSRLAEARAASLAFAEVVDGRISRLHCTIRMEPGLRLPLAAGRSYAAIVEDRSSNGTFVNGERIPPGVAIGLKEGDRVSLVMSITPLIEQTFTLRTGAQHPSEALLHCLSFTEMLIHST